MYPDTDTIPGYIRERRVEAGKLHSKVPIIYSLSSSGFPVWLFSLDSTNTSKLFIPQYDDAGSFVQDIELQLGTFAGNVLRFLLQRLQNQPIEFTSPPPNLNVVRLCSGPSIQYLITQMGLSTIPTIGLLSEHFAGRLRNGRLSGDLHRDSHHIVWHRVRHTTVGGSTNFTALLGCLHIELSPRLSVLRRTIRIIVDFGIKPTFLPIILSAAATANRYMLDDILQVGHYDCPLHYPTSFSASGWGSRPLTTSELAKAHGYTQYFAGRSDFDSRFLLLPPLQILDAVLDGTASLLVTPDTAVSTLPPRLICKTPVEEPTQSWLPHLQRFLPHTWVDQSLITTKAMGNGSD
jgi:hypothetical protein